MLAFERSTGESVVLTSESGTRLEIMYLKRGEGTFQFEFSRGTGEREIRDIPAFRASNYMFEPGLWIVVLPEEKRSNLRVTLKISAPRIIKILRSELEGVPA